MDTSKRQFLDRTLNVTAGMAVAGLLGSSRVLASVEDVQQAMNEFTGGKTAVPGVVKLTTPEIAENGNSVPVSVSVDRPMSEDDHVESVIILADDNPNAAVARFHFSPASGEALASTRIRLARTQNVLAIAKTSKGEVFTATNHVKVTIGGCGG
ncbi:thiosulfate oxidation carrier protein SoxY [Granulosicoccus sp. 3-233]|uniref:thiosulfate oxidation carrier protein SoxY n=1 Tax=Granulosicoccus sp. 3-233 TaxID=3417969 RepID=UPI003D359609